VPGQSRSGGVADKEFPVLKVGHPETIPIAVNQPVEKNAQALSSEPKGWAFPQSAFAETLGFCAVFVGLLLEIPGQILRFCYASERVKKRSP
jgi:hypothetical protein